MTAFIKKNNSKKRGRRGAVSAASSLRVARILAALVVVVVMAAVVVRGLTPSSSSRPNPSRSGRTKPNGNSNGNNGNNHHRKTSDLSASSLSFDRVVTVGNNSNNKKNKNNNHRRNRPQQQQQQQYRNHDQKRKQSASSSFSFSSDSVVPSIFVKNLSYEATKSDVVEACRKRYGSVDSVWIPKGKGKKGYASVLFRDVEAAREALQDGRLDVLGRKAFLVESNRQTRDDPKADAFRFLAAFSRGDDRLEDRSETKVREEAKAAGVPRSQKERGILAAAFARMGARDELLAILEGGEGRSGGKGSSNNRRNNGNHRNANNHPQSRAAAASTSVYNAALSALTVSTPQQCSLVQELVHMAEDGPGVNARTYATAIASIKRGASNSAAMAVDDLRDIASLFLRTARRKGVANHVVYNELISCLGKSGSVGESVDVDDASSDGTLSSSSSSSSSSWKMATDVLDEMFEDDCVEPTEVSLNAAIASCAGAGQLDAALEIYDAGFERAGIEPTMVTTNSMLSVVHRWTKKKRRHHHHHHHQSASSSVLDPADARTALGVVDRLIEDAVERGDDVPGDDPITTNALVSALGAAGDTARALRIFEDARRNGSATVVTANAALAALALDGSAEEAADLVRNLPETDVTSWNTALSACRKGGVDGGTSGLARDLFEDMPYKPDSRTFVAVLAALSEGDDNDDKSSIVGDLLARADAAEETTIFVLNAALAAYDRLGDPGSARSLLEEGFASREIEPDAVSFDTLIRALGRASDPDGALEVFFSTTIMPAALRRDERSLCSVMAALTAGGAPDRALEVFEEERRRHRDDDDSPAIRAEALRACLAANDPDRALELLRVAKTKESEKKGRSDDDNVATTIAMTACARSGLPRHLAAGRKLFDDLEEPDLVAFNAAIALAAAAGDPEGAVALLRDLEGSSSSRSPDAVSYCSAIAACEKKTGGSPDPDLALRLLRESREALGRPDEGCYIAAVQTLAAAGWLEEALRLVEEEDDATLEAFDDQSRYVLYRTVQVACASRGWSNEADRMSATIRRQGLTALAPVATALVGGTLREFDNHIELPRDADDDSSSSREETIGDAAIANAVRDMVDRTGHRFVTEALPLEFRRAPIKTKEISLSNHAEKKALVRLLLEEKQGNEKPLSVSINFKMCADCHAFFKGAGSYLNREITVREPSTVHVFGPDGTCSCGDRWRWEERHQDDDSDSSLSPLLRVPMTTATTTSTTADNGGRRRFGRLPPKLAPSEREREIAKARACVPS